MAKQGLPAPDPLVAAAGRGYGEYLLTRRLTNRLPRSLLPLAGAILVLVGVLLWSGAVAFAETDLTGLGVFGVIGGVVVTLLGLLSWSQRQGGRLLVAANPAASAPPTEPRSSGS
ncbi:hypothetical protein CLV92_1342 [Kineococcus xinjiangensis]|uniref:Uncharacterized protein n=2 Tax=Kineococcus xinjiangensis TaxID=512762 RepID=A0A2S6IBT9_9ACTN|nr:hypothetical protein CLV92_1342 [Kineococcus xinjiangensis]